MNNLIDLPHFGDDRGSLVAVESMDTIPFEVKRIYYIFDTKKDVARGFHAHKNLSQCVICVKGSCDFVLDDGDNKEIYNLNSAKEGLLIEGIYWREMHNFSEDCVLMVLASDHYNEIDYIKDYQEFLGIIRNT
ncbi:WxcM-like domain-containing protein [Vibrio aestuarianus]|uniref:sugar 3,4-ketoisomerase n=1 Tax=Vibrio aestuarianus TaxID=28171 RepID=UPI001559D7AA|nr:FdtA/QdtA family cupin domain-containing protein [Vibrio aestuarianus]NGZ15547.1 WxcM-like domain-containing protein [Vibrio aestuarianus]NKZ51695.1 WxcM-like domain-containing protein [Vibrio aestuarianus]